MLKKSTRKKRKKNFNGKLQHPLLKKMASRLFGVNHKPRDRSSSYTFMYTTFRIVCPRKDAYITRCCLLVLLLFFVWRNYKKKKIPIHFFLRHFSPGSTSSTSPLPSASWAFFSGRRGMVSHCARQFRYISAVAAAASPMGFVVVLLEPTEGAGDPRPFPPSAPETLGNGNTVGPEGEINT